jgi:hypothetical protein
MNQLVPGRRDEMRLMDRRSRRTIMISAGFALGDTL